VYFVILIQDQSQTHSGPSNFRIFKVVSHKPNDKLQRAIKSRQYKLLSTHPLKVHGNRANDSLDSFETTRQSLIPQTISAHNITRARLILNEGDEKPRVLNTHRSPSFYVVAVPSILKRRPRKVVQSATKITRGSYGSVATRTQR
jgi:hypothetical protein